MTTNPPSSPFDAFAPTAADPFDDRRVGHLFRRAGFGPTPEWLAKFSGKPPGQAIDWLLSYEPGRPDPLDAMLDNLEGYIKPFQSIESAQMWWVFRMLNSGWPLQERVALLWHSHFATSAAKVDRPQFMHNQIDLFRRMGMGSFRDMVVAVGRDPAMLLWLDGRNNKKGSPNENYGRELMELFTLGIGHYTEHDVQEVARAFTGWRLDNETPRFDAKQWDEGEKEILGRKSAFNSESAVDQILAHPAASKFIARKLLREFVHPSPTDGHVDHYAQRLVEHHWEVRPVLREMLSSRLFFSDWAYRSKIKSPATLVIGSLVALGGKANTNFALKQMSRMGQALMMPPTVKGWDGEESWINANTVLLRFNFGLAVAASRGDEFARKPDVLHALQSQNLKTADAVLDHLVRLLLDGRLPAEERDKLLDYMNRDEKNQPKVFELSDKTFNSKVRGVLHLLMATPEFQLA